MATSTRLLFVYVDGQRKTVDSRNASLLFQKLGFTNNGVDQGIEIASTGTGFDFANKALTNLTLDGSLLDNASLTQNKISAANAAAGYFLQTNGSNMSWAEVQQTFAGLTDVELISTTNNDLLRYDTAAGKWENFAADDSTVEVAASPVFDLTWASDASLTSPGSLVFDWQNNLFVHNADGSIVKITPSKVYSVFATGVPCNSMTIDSAGNIYTVNDDNTITKTLTNGSSSVWVTNSLLNATIGITVDPSDSLYVISEFHGHTHQICKVLPNGTVSSFASIGTYVTNAITCDSAGNLYVLSTNQTAGNAHITKVDSGGNPTVLGISFGTWIVKSGVITIDSAGVLYIFGEDSVSHDYYLLAIAPNLSITPIALDTSYPVGITTLGTTVYFSNGANNCVTSLSQPTVLKIKDGGVGTTQLAANAVTTAQIAASAVTSAQIAASAVTSSQIADSAVTNDKIAWAAVGDLQVSAGALTQNKFSGDGTFNVLENVATNDVVCFAPSYPDMSGTGVLKALATNAALARTSIGIMEGDVTAPGLGVVFVGTPGMSAIAPVWGMGSDQGWTANAPVFVSNVTAGALMQSIPTTSGDVVYRVGWAYDNQSLTMDPEFLYIVI